MLRYLKPDCYECSYFDTDSCIAVVASEDLTSLVRPEFAEFKEEIIAEILEDPKSSQNQTGLMKFEGCYLAGYFRSAKSYLMRHKVETDDDYIRVKSIPRKLHKKMVKEEYFGQDPGVNKVVTRCVSMGATKSLQIVVTESSKSVNHCLNFKRRMIVRRPFFFFCSINLVAFHSILFLF